jgi:lipopolysaccharide/colanic/teichoic acid biosynthesis glycosyltransferase
VAGGWYRRWGKRGTDMVLVALSLPVTAPLTAVGWLLARLSTRDSGWFTQERIGRDGRTFVIWKLRTMRAPDPGDDQARFAHEIGVAAASAARITPVGAWLRRTKLDELPQLWNVVRGEMSLVGPRPDVPEWLGVLRGHPDALAVRPGLTSLASLAYHDEEEALAGEADPVAAYAERVLPHKLHLNEVYARGLSPGLDLRVLALTVLSIVSRPRAQAAVRRTIEDLSPDA